MARRYPAVVLLSAIVGGILLTDLVRPPAWSLIVVLLGAAIVGLWMFFRQRHTTAAILFAVAAGAFCAFRFASVVYDGGPHHLNRFLHEPLTADIFGRVADWPLLRVNRTEIIIALDSIGTTTNRRVEGSVLLRINDTTTALQRGDRVIFRGRLYSLRGGGSLSGFDYERYLNLKGVFGVVYLPTALTVMVDRRPDLGYFGFVDRVRSAILDSFERNLTPRASALAGGFLIGETRHIPADIYQRFRDSGTLHLLAVSGSNVALVVLVILAALRPFRLSRVRRGFVLIGVIVVFCGLSYFEPSVVRASIMAVLIITAGMLERKVDLNQIIALTAVIALMAAPEQLFDVGFQLSFATAWGLIYFVPRATKLFRRYLHRRWYRWLVFPVIISVIAQLCSAPLSGYYFGQFPVIAVVANLLIVPAVSLAVVGSLVLLAADMILPLLGLLVGGFVSAWLEWIIAVLELFGGAAMPKVDTAGWSGSPTAIAGIIAFYLLLAAAFAALNRKRLRRIVIIATVVILNLGIVLALITGDGERRLSLHVDSVPGGLMLLLRQQGRPGSWLVIDGLRSRDYAVDEKVFQPALRQLGIDSLAAVVLLAADFGAVDDVVRLANRYGCNDVYVRPAMLPFMRDAFARCGEAAGVNLGALGEAATHRIPDGIALRNDVLQIKIGDRLIVVADHCPASAPETGTADTTSLLIVSRPVWKSSEELDSLGREYFRVVFSRLLSSESSASIDPHLSPKSAPPDFVHDISRQGSISLTLTLRRTAP